MLPLKPKSQLNASGLVFSWLSWVEVGSPNRSKIDQKTKSRWEGNLASIFHRFFIDFGIKNPWKKTIQFQLFRCCIFWSLFVLCSLVPSFLHFMKISISYQFLRCFIDVGLLCCCHSFVEFLFFCIDF